MSSSGSSKRSRRYSPRSSSATRARRPAAAAACGCCATSCRNPASTARAIRRERRRLPLWQDTRFRRFWIGETLSQFGDRISELALPLIAVIRRGGRDRVGLLTAAVWAPNLLSLLVGNWVDTARKRDRS